MRLHLLALRRYPVKAMAGESLGSVALDPRGLVGDRWFAVVDAEGRLASHKTSRRFRRRDAIVGYRAETGPDGGVRVSRDGKTWSVGDRALDDDLTATLGEPVAVRPEAAVPHQDGGAVSLVGSATLRWCEERWGVDADPRRLRVNLVVETAEPFEEESWLGRTVAVGDATLRVVERIERCRTIDLAQDGLRETTAWLRPLGAERDLQLAVYADVVRPGTLEVTGAGR